MTFAMVVIFHLFLFVVGLRMSVIVDELNCIKGTICYLLAVVGSYGLFHDCE